jgi:hypothetical protein
MRASQVTSRILSQDMLAVLDHAMADISEAGIIWISGDRLKGQVGQLILEGAQAIAADRQQSIDSFKMVERQLERHPALQRRYDNRRCRAIACSDRSCQDAPITESRAE